MLFQLLKIRNQGFNNTLYVQLESRVFAVNENYNMNPLCVNILPEDKMKQNANAGPFLQSEGLDVLHFYLLKPHCRGLPGFSYL